MRLSEIQGFFVFCGVQEEFSALHYLHDQVCNIGRALRELKTDLAVSREHQIFFSQTTPAIEAKMTMMRFFRVI